MLLQINNDGQSEERKICLRANENCAGKCRWLVLVLHLIGWKSDTSFLDQSLSVVKQKQRYRKLLLPLHWKLLYQYKKTNINLNGEKTDSLPSTVQWLDRSLLCVRYSYKARTSQETCHLTHSLCDTLWHIAEN